MLVSCLQLVRKHLLNMGDTFLYFGFGSNLLKERIHISNPSAQYVCTAKLKDYKLDFGFQGDWWRGSVATVTECPGDHVWGVVWRLNKEHMATLDEQEGVAAKIYKPLVVDVKSEHGENLNVRTYQLIGNYDHEEKKPSPYYLQVILSGAQENNLPADYIERLSKISHNGYQGDVAVYAKLKTVPKTPVFLKHIVG